MTVQNHPADNPPSSWAYPKSQIKQYDIAIIGAGVVGMVCCHLLAKEASRSLFWIVSLP